jgi:hypothetical protein
MLPGCFTTAFPLISVFNARNELAPFGSPSAGHQSHFLWRWQMANGPGPLFVGVRMSGIGAIGFLPRNGISRTSLFQRRRKGDWAAQTRLISSGSQNSGQPAVGRVETGLVHIPFSITVHAHLYCGLLSCCCTFLTCLFTFLLALSLVYHLNTM